MLNCTITTDESRALCRKISGMSGGVCFLGFSRGKDSIASWLHLRTHFKQVIPVYFATVPHLEFVDRSLAYYETFFDTKIIRLMDGDCNKAMLEMVYQQPCAENRIDESSIEWFSKADCFDVLREEMNLPDAWTAYGMSMYDSFFRLMSVKRSQGENKKARSFNPCFDWPRQLIHAALDESGILLPDDYLMCDRTMSALPDARHLSWLIANRPDEFARIEAYFPLIRAQVYRNEFRRSRTSAAPCRV